MGALGGEKNYCYYHGIAQGSPLSPTLSSLVLVPEIYLKDKKASTAGYADDGLRFGKNQFNPSEDLNPSIESGITIHNIAPKSQWVKQDGKWLTDLKFLGKKYLPNSLHPENEILNSYQGGLIANATRTPKNYKFEKARSFIQ